MINGVPRILLIRLSAIGDVVRVLPALHAIRDTFPHAQIDWAIEGKSADIVQGNPLLDRVLVFERPAEFRAGARAFWRFCRQIRANRYDIVVDFHGIFKSGMISLMAGVPDRYGFARPRGREMSFLAANHRVTLPSNDLNRVEENLRLSDALCGKRPASSNVTIYVEPEVQDQVNDYTDEIFDGGKRIVAMHVPVDRPEKQWPLGHYAALADMLLADGRFEVLLTWGPGQLASAESVVRQSRRQPVLAPEIPDLKHYAALINRADLYVGGDTGPMHIAAIMGTPVVAIFGGTDPLKHAPYTTPSEVLQDTTPGLPVEERLRRVTPEAVYEACVRVANWRRPDPPSEMP